MRLIMKLSVKYFGPKLTVLKNSVKSIFFFFLKHYILSKQLIFFVKITTTYMYNKKYIVYTLPS